MHTLYQKWLWCKVKIKNGYIPVLYTQIVFALLYRYQNILKIKFISKNKQLGNAKFPNWYTKTLKSMQIDSFSWKH
jgi:hypothetical protein